MKKIEILAVAILLAMGLMAQENSSKTSALGTVKTDEKTGVVQVAYNVNDTGSYKGNSEEIALQYLTDHAVEFLKGETAALKHLKTIKSPAGTHVGYIQTVDGIPIIGAITTVNLNSENKITFVANHYQPGIKISTTPQLTAEQAIGIARQSFAETDFKTVIENKTELSVFVTDNHVPLLVWKVNMLPDFGGDWYFLIDALTGEIIKKENIEINVDGSGKVFEPDPGSYFQDSTLPDNSDANYFTDQSVYKTRTLTGLNTPVSGNFYLQGEYAYSMDIGSPYDAVVSSPYPVFNFTRNQNGFEEANCYYHLDNTIRFVRSLGFAPEWNNQSTTTTDIVFDARGETGINAHYYPSADYITYGVPTNNVDAGEDQSVIIHELGHAFHDALIIGGTIGGSSDRYGIGEGISDYLGIDYRRQLSEYRPNARCNWFVPTAPNTIRPISEVEFDSWWVGRSIYEQMQTWASSLMDLEYINTLYPSQGYRLGREVVTTIQLASLSYVTADDDRFDNVLAMYQADIDIYNGAHLPDLIEVYHNRLLFTGTENQVMNTNIAANTTWSGYKMVEGNRSVNAGATLTLAPSSILVLNGDLTISAGANLVIGDNVKIYGFGYKINIVGNLVCNYGSEVITDANTILYCNGGNISLNAGSYITMNGTLSVAANKTANISGSGFMVLNSSINAETGSSLTFTGAGTSTKMVEVNAAVTFSSNLTSVSFTNGKIVMNNSTSQMKFDGPTSTVSFNNILVTSATGSYLGNSGITIYNVPNITAQNSTFEYNKYGLYLMCTSNHPRAIIDNCTFRYCYDGLLVYNSGATITNSEFLNNSDMGIYCLSMDQTSSYYNVTSSSNTNYGMYYEGSSTSSYSMDFCGLSTNNYGIYTQGPLTADISCSSSVNNTNYGIMAYNNSNLDISSSDFHGNKIAIQGSGSAIGNYNNNFALNNGYNDLRDNATTGSWCLYGNFRAILTSPVAANNNYWKNGGGAPVNNIDYLVYGSSGNQISITDNSPESTFALCNVPESLVEGTVLTSAGYTDAGVYMEITTSLGTQPLNEAVETILNENEKTGTVYDDNTRFELLSEVLNNSFKMPNANEKWYIHYAYKEFKKLTGSIEYDTKNIEKALKAIRKINKDQLKFEDKKIDFGCLVDEALLLDYSGNFDEAISLLQASKSLLSSDDAAYFDELICKINLNKKVNDGNIDDDIVEAYKECSCSKDSEKSGTINDKNKDNNSSLTTNTDIELAILPNPVMESTLIKSYIPENYSNAELVIINSSGATVLIEPVSNGTIEKKIYTTDWSEGIYLVMIKVQGKLMNSQKMLIVK